nr:MAG: Transcriptional regulator, RHH-like, CopG [Bacteriophage sp.]
MAKGGLSRIKRPQGNNVINDPIEEKDSKAQTASNVVEVKEHRLVIDVPEDLYWRFKTTSGMRKKKMKESMIQALERWIESS